MQEATNQPNHNGWTYGVICRILCAVLLAGILWGMAAELALPHIVQGFIQDLWRALIMVAIMFFIAALMQRVVGEFKDTSSRKSPLHQYIVTSLVNKFFRFLFHKTFSYWFIVIFLIIFGIHLGKWVDEQHIWLNTRYRIYQGLQAVSPYPQIPKKTFLVLIGDEEFWKGELARRLPLKRAYLATLLQAIDSANPAVIALDFDFRAAILDGEVCNQPGKLPYEQCEYHEETKNFLEIMNQIAESRVIILPRTVQYDKNGPCYKLEPAIYDGFPFSQKASKNIRQGYIELPYDVRQVPLSLLLNDGTLLDSLATAIVRQENPDMLPDVSELDCYTESLLPYGDFIRAKDFSSCADESVQQGKKKARRCSASDILNMDFETRESMLQHQLVLIGGVWHGFASGRGEPIDSHLTPVGRIPGVFLHATYVEALLAGHTHKPFGPRFGKGIDLLLSVAVAIVFALDLRRSLWKSFAVITLCVILIVSAYILWQNFGMFFDFFIPITLLFGHAGFEKIREWRSEAREVPSLRKELRRLRQDKVGAKEA